MFLFSLTQGLTTKRCRLDAIRLEAVFQTPTSHCTAHFETKERKPRGRHAQSKKVGLQYFGDISKAVVSPRSLEHFQVSRYGSSFILQSLNTFVKQQFKGIQSKVSISGACTRE